MKNNVFRLLGIHQRLDAEIQRERQHRWPDLFRVQRLKRLKLAIKDRLHRLATGRLPTRMT